MSMRCPNCAAEVLDGMQFCGSCGAAVGVRCEACGAPAAPDQRFCGACGRPLRPLAPPVRERRLVSVLFCDLVGFTTFSESRDPEDVRDVLDQYFAAARRIVSGYGGAIEKFIGDAVMAVWGAPVAREDDAERAVRAGLDLTVAVAALADRLAIAELRVRVGVLTGEAAVEVGSAGEGMVTGDAVNTAARIQSIADPGTVLVDDTTRLACERNVAFEPAGEHPVKGKSALVRVSRAVGVRDELDGTAGSGAVEPPLVGRDAQLSAIERAFESLLAPGSGVRVLFVIGDAGIGKSRLSRELEKRAGAGAPARWHRGRSLAFGDGAGLSALAEIVRMAAGIGRADAKERQRALVDQLLRAHFADDEAEGARVGRAVARLLDLDDGHELIEQGELFSAWRALFERLAVDGPVMLVLEELQLADQALLEFISHLREWSHAVPIMLLGLSRPEARVKSLAALAERIELQPLSDQEMDELVAGAVDGAPEGLMAAIRAEGGGIPLYAVETLRALADRGVLAVENSHYVLRTWTGELSVPPTIRALVSSRLDDLEPVDRRVLSAGAVLGESFSAAGAAAVAGVQEDQAQVLLDGLVAKALLGLDRDPRSPLRGRYTFLQGVVRRVVLARLSRRERKRCHLAAVEFLSHADAAEPELAAVLAAHLLAAEEADPRADDVPAIRERARGMLGAAAERSAAVGALNEALSLFDRAAGLAADELERATILERAGAVAHRAGDTDAAVERYRASQEIYAGLGRDRERLHVHTHELHALCYVRSPTELLPALRELDSELGGERDAVKALASALLAFMLYQYGQYQEALAVAQAAAATAEECGDRDEFVHALSVQASALQGLERPEEAIAVQRRAVALAQEHSPRRVALLAGNLAVSLASIGRYREAADSARTAIAAAERTAERFLERWARAVLGRTLCSLGEWDAAVEESESVKEHVPPFMIGMAIAPLVVIALERGQNERALALVEEHDVRSGVPASAVFEGDFRMIGAAAPAVVRRAPARELSRLLAGAQPFDYGEWTGWLSPIVDHLLAAPDRAALEEALAALCGPGAMKRTPPVLAQAARLEAHLAVAAGEARRALEAWERARRLASDCGLAFEAAVIDLERGEHAAESDAHVDREALGAARATFERLRAAPWLGRAERVIYGCFDTL